MKTGAYTLSIKRNNEFGMSVFALFNWLSGLNNKEMAVLNKQKNKLLTVSKKESDVIELGFNYEKLEGKFYAWHFSKEKTLELDEAETILFIQCCHAAHFYLNKQDYNIGSQRDKIHNLYKAIVKELKANTQYNNAFLNIFKK